MRVVMDSQWGERRDAIDQKWYSFLSICDIFPILLPNAYNMGSMLSSLPLSGVILSGGNSLNSMGGDAPEKDYCETRFLEVAIDHNLPVMGVCRGMQFIQDYFGVKLEKIENHAGSRHDIILDGEVRNVNSYHHYGSTHTTDCLEIVARASDNIIEAISHNTLPIQGIMWHPEREENYHKNDIALFKKHFKA